MTYQLTIEKKGDVLWAAATGTRSKETVLAISKDIFAACFEHKVTRVLVDVRTLEGRLDMMESYEIAAQHFPAMRDRSVITHNAILDLKEFEDNYRFFETVAVNRGLMLRVFSEPEQAMAWLKE